MAKKADSKAKATTSQSEVPQHRLHHEIINYFNHVMVDGRFVKECTKDPVAVARQIGVSLSPSAAERIQSVKGVNPATFTRGKGGVQVAGIGFIVTIVLIVASRDIETHVTDESGIEKL